MFRFQMIRTGRVANATSVKMLKPRHRTVRIRIVSSLVRYFVRTGIHQTELDIYRYRIAMSHKRGVPEFSHRVTIQNEGQPRQYSVCSNKTYSLVSRS